SPFSRENLVTDGVEVYRIILPFLTLNPAMRAVHCLAALALAAVFPASAADNGKVFRYAFQVAETGFDPAEVSDLYSSNIIANIFDPPLTYDFLARPVKLIPNTVEALPEVLEEGTLYRLKVRPGIYFA